MEINKELDAVLPFRIGPLFDDVLGWTIATDLTIAEALTHEAFTSFFNRHGQEMTTELEKVREAGRLKVDIYPEDGDAYIEESLRLPGGDNQVGHDLCLIVELSIKPEGESE